MFINNFDPVAFSLFSLEFRWYSLSYIFGILTGWVLAKRIFIKDVNLKEKFDDFITYIIIGIIIGGRLGYVIFYNLDYYLENIFEIFKIWNGGMSFHGGLLGVIVMSVLFAKKHNHNSYIYLDIVSLVAPIGIFFGVPKFSQKPKIHIAIISENILEIFGAVIKSPFNPKGFFCI